MDEFGYNENVFDGDTTGDEEEFCDSHCEDSQEFVQLSISYIKLTLTSNIPVTVAGDFIGMYCRVDNHTHYTAITMFGGTVINVKETPEEIDMMLGFKNEGK